MDDSILAPNRGRLTVIEGDHPQAAEWHARTVLGTKRFAAAAEDGKQSSPEELLLLAASPGAFASAPQLP